MGDSRSLSNRRLTILAALLPSHRTDRHACGTGQASGRISPSTCSLKQGRFMQRICCLFLAIFLVSGCAKIATEAGMGPKGETGPAGTSLAYEHTVTISVSPQQIPERMSAVREACVTASLAHCSLIRFEETAGSRPSGLVVIRLEPDGVEPIVALASEGGVIGSHQTRAEDLAEPVADANRLQQQLESQRTLLLEFKARTDISVADMLSIARELAAVESQLLEVERSQAELGRRIETNLLTIRYTSENEEGQWARIGAAVSDSASSFVGGVVEAIELVAFGLPFLLLAFPLALLWRFMWRRATRNRNRDET